MVFSKNIKTVDPNKQLEELFNKRLESNKILSNKFNELYEYIKPFVQQNDKMNILLTDIKFTIDLVLTTDDLVLVSTLLANNLAWKALRPKIPFKVTCPKCKEVVYDIEELEKAFNDIYK